MIWGGQGAYDWNIHHLSEEERSDQCDKLNDSTRREDWSRVQKTISKSRTPKNLWLLTLADHLLCELCFCSISLPPTNAPVQKSTWFKTRTHSCQWFTNKDNRLKKSIKNIHEWITRAYWWCVLLVFIKSVWRSDPSAKNLYDKSGIWKSLAQTFTVDI